MGQVVSSDKQISGRDRHVFGQLTLDRKVRLVGISVFEGFADVQREGQHRSKTRKCLIVETLASELILRGRRGARRTVDAGDGAWEIADDHSSLKYLGGVEQRDRRWTALRRQDALLLLNCIGNVGIESDGQQRMVVKDSYRPANHCLRVTLDVPRETNPRRVIILVSRNALLHVQCVLRSQKLGGCERNA